MALREMLLKLGVQVDDKAVKKTTSALDGIKKAALAAGAVFLTGKLAQGFKSIIDDASDAAEISSKFAAVFTEETGRATKTAEELSKRIGQSRVDIQGMTADVGALVKPLLGSSKASAEMAAKVTELAFDISSFENVLPKEALGALRSAIIGSSEPMLRFGVDTRKAALEQFALEKGMKKSVKAMNQSEITSLRLALITERLGSKGAIGDATRTAGGFANKSRALEGAFKDLRVELGGVFLPIMTELLTLLVDLVKDVTPALKTGFEGLLTVFKLVSSVVKGLLSPFERLDTALLALGSVTLVALGIAFNKVGVSATLAGLKAAGAWVLASLPLLLAILLVGFIIAAILLLIDDFVKMGEGAESVSGTMIQGFLDLVDEIGSIPGAMFEMLNTAFKFWGNFFMDLLGLSGNSIDLMMATLKNAWQKTIEFMSGLFDSFIGGIVKAFESVGNFFSDLFGGGEEAGATAGRPRAQSVRDQISETQTGGQSIRDGIQATRAGMSAVTAPAMTPGTAGVGGGTSMINQPNTNINIDVDASGNAAPNDVGEQVARQVDMAMERQNRQMVRPFQVAMENT